MKLESKVCKVCSSRFERRRSSSGEIQRTASFRAQKYCSIECGGIAKRGRSSESEAAYRWQSGMLVRDRCNRCGSKTSRLLVHHMDENPRNNNDSNLETLCYQCHGRVHSNMYDGIIKIKCFCGKSSLHGSEFCLKHKTRHYRHKHPLAIKIQGKNNKWHYSVGT